MIIRISVGIIFFALAILTPFYFESILFFSITTFGFGWVLSTVLIRLFVILLLFLALIQWFKLSVRLKKIRYWLVFLIALGPGFGISFIAPIYTTDYGMFNDGMKITHQEFLTEALNVDELPENGHLICAFFTTDCPHCKYASEKLGANIESGQKIPVYCFFTSEAAEADRFILKHDGLQFKTHLIQSDSAFVSLAGNTFPSIFLINQKGETKYHWTGDEMNYTALDYLKSLEQ